MKRLCEVASELRDPVMKLGEGGDAQPLRMWASLRCPKRDHCDKSRPCEGMTPQNLVTIASIEDRLFISGFTRG